MTFNHLTRRLHLYLGLALLPWFLLYAVSSLPFSHPPFFEDLDRAKGLPTWIPRFERAYDVPVPGGNDLRPLGARILADIADTGINGSYGVYRQSPNQVNVYVYTFWRSTQIKYFTDQHRLVAEDRRFRWDHFFTGMHAKGGFEQDGWIQNSWSVLVDVVCLGLLLWILSGVYMWWKLPAQRGWGWFALAGGCISFILLLWRL